MDKSSMLISALLVVAMFSCLNYLSIKYENEQIVSTSANNYPVIEYNDLVRRIKAGDVVVAKQYGDKLVICLVGNEWFEYPNPNNMEIYSLLKFRGLDYKA
jgi:hypothetical protein